jgi:hypothetical protein
MNVERFLEALGVDHEELWPTDPAGRLRAKCDRLTEHVRHLHQLLVRCQRSILALRLRTERACSLADHYRDLLQRKECRYQTHLARLTLAKRKLAKLRHRLACALANSSSFAR